MGIPNPTLERRAIARDYGMQNVNAIADAAVRVNTPFYAALALTEGESGGRNIYGGDLGGVFSANGDQANRPVGGIVTDVNFGIYLIRVNAGDTPNGWGPVQLTYNGRLSDGKFGGYARQMLERGMRPWDPTDNITIGLELLAGNFDKVNDWAIAGALYNGGPSWRTKPKAVAYGRALAARCVAWRKRFGLS